METNNSNHENNQSGRKFIQQSAVLGAGVMLAGTTDLFAMAITKVTGPKNITTKGYAARDTSGKLSPWTFERRAVGDNDAWKKVLDKKARYRYVIDAATI